MTRSVDRWWLLVTLVVAVLILLPELDQGWFPHDEGVLGQSAERVLGGEVPHRDFDEIYTGLLTYLHAATFRLLGIKAEHLRYPLALATLAWLVVCYRILRRFVQPVWAAAISVVILLWSVPNYPAPMPSWYNLFLATAGVLSLIKWAESSDVRWLIITGMLGGLSFLVKLSGVFFLAGAILGVIGAGLSAPREEPSRGASIHIRILIVGMAIAICAGLIMVVGTEPRALIRFVLPPGALLVGLAALALRPVGRRHSQGLGELLLPVFWLVCGAVMPMLVAVISVAVAGGLAEAVDGVLIRPFRRTGFAAYQPPSPTLLIAGLPLVWLLWPRPSLGSDMQLRAHLPVGVSLLMVLFLARSEPGIYQAAWGAAWSLPAIVSVLGCLYLVRELWQGTSLERPVAQILWPMLMIAAFGILVEFPFAAPIYSLYALPLAILAAVALLRAKPPNRSAFGMLVVAFFLLFGWFHLRPGTPRNLGRGFYAAADTVSLGLVRAGLRVSGREAGVYRGLIELLDSLSERRVLWAGPDAPEIYFLSGMRNTTRTMFDFLDREPVWGDSFLSELHEREVSLVALNLDADFSPKPSAATIAGLRGSFPHSQPIGGWLVLWR